VRFDRNAWRVVVDPDFDLAAWKDGLRAKAKKSRKVTPAELAEACGEDCRTRSEFVQRFEARASERSVGDALGEAVENRLLERTGKGPATRYNRGPAYRPAP
jgi:hypothetical protein